MIDKLVELLKFIYLSVLIEILDLYYLRDLLNRKRKMKKIIY